MSQNTKEQSLDQDHNKAASKADDMKGKEQRHEAHEKAREAKVHEQINEEVTTELKKSGVEL